MKANLIYKDASRELPDVNVAHDIKVIVRITGLCSYTASPYEEYKIISFRPKLNCFIEWGYNSSGEMVATTYNHETSKKYDVVTHWAYFDEVPQKLIDKYEKQSC